jgi:predicted dehydrogenase
MADKVRLASVGLGWWGNVLAEAAQTAGGDIVTGYARTPAAREEFANKHGCRPAATYEEVLADPDVDAVMIATPNTTHGDCVVAAAAAGKHVFVEKPFTLTVADGKRAIAAMEAAGKVLFVGHNKRRQPANRRLKGLIDGGELGEVVSIDTTLTKPMALGFDPGYWRADRTEAPLGAMTSLGVHMIDTMHYLLGPIERVSTFTTELLPGLPIDHITMTIYEFASGQLGYLGTSFVAPHTTSVVVRGTEGAAFNEENGSRFYRQGIDDPDRVEEPVEVLDTITAELDEFVRCVRGEAAPETGGAEGLAVIAVMEAMVASSESGTAQNVSDYR